MSCRHPARLTSSLTALASHASGDNRNRDGWGLAFYQGSDVALYRDTTSADTCPLVPWLEANGPATTLSLGYIRQPTQGAIHLANTGPFSRELDGRMQVFAHNGNLKNLEQSPLVTKNGSFQPIGETDSELAFCLLPGWQRSGASARPRVARDECRAASDPLGERAAHSRKLGAHAGRRSRCFAPG